MATHSEQNRPSEQHLERMGYTSRDIEKFKVMAKNYPTNTQTDLTDRNINQLRFVQYLRDKGEFNEGNTTSNLTNSYVCELMQSTARSIILEYDPESLISLTCLTEPIESDRVLECVTSMRDAYHLMTTAIRQDPSFFVDMQNGVPTLREYCVGGNTYGQLYVLLDESKKDGEILLEFTHPKTQADDQYAETINIFSDGSHSCALSNKTKKIELAKFTISGDAEQEPLNEIILNRPSNLADLYLQSAPVE